jgi:hypothetical protein
MYVGKSWSLPERCFTLVGSSLIRKHLTRPERLACDKHSSLLRTITNVKHSVTICLAGLPVNQMVSKFEMSRDHGLFAALLIIILMNVMAPMAIPYQISLL